MTTLSTNNIVQSRHCPAREDLRLVRPRMFLGVFSALLPSLAFSQIEVAVEAWVKGMTKISPDQSGVPRILVVDDEEPIRRFAERVLRDAGYEVFVSPDGSTALEIVAQQGPFDVFVIDVSMLVEMSGDELARQLRSADPDVKVLYFTGYSERLFNAKSPLWEHEAFLEKPVSTKGLLEAVSLLLFGHTHGPR